MQQHAKDMLAALDELKFRSAILRRIPPAASSQRGCCCSSRERFGRVLALDPVTPLGMAFNTEQIGLFRAMMASREVTRAVMATAASSLFVPESLAPNAIPQFREGLGESQALFERILEQTFGVSEGIWIGTPVQPQSASGRAANWSGGCRRSSIRTWCCGARRTAGFLRRIFM